MGKLGKMGYICEGLDNDRCPWPAGGMSTHIPYCAKGYKFSYLSQKCYLNQPN